MRCRVPLAVSMLALLASTAGAQGDDGDVWWQGCYIDEDTIDCRENGSSKDDGGSWGDNALEIGLTIGGLAVTGAAGFFTTRQVRRRRHAMSGMLTQINAAYAAAKDAPEQGIPELQALRGEIMTRYHRGRMEDAQYIELDKRITECVTNLRVMALERRFPELPTALFTELRHVVRDGLLSEADVAQIERRAANLKVASADRRALAESLRQWAGEGRAAPPPEKRVRLALVAK